MTPEATAAAGMGDRELVNTENHRPPSLRELIERLVVAIEEHRIEDRSRPFTLPEIARRWQCSEKAVERLCLAGKLRSFKPARVRLVRPVALAKYERAQSGD